MKKRLVNGRGNVFGNLLIIGEAPGSKEDIEGKPFVGKSGKLLEDLLTKTGINTRQDVYFCNVIKCRPPKNRKPTIQEVSTHKPWLMQQIKLIDPKLIILTGSTAMKTILEVNTPISSLRGKWIKREGREILTIFHPSYLLRFSSNTRQGPFGLTLKDLESVRNKLYAL